MVLKFPMVKLKKLLILLIVNLTSFLIHHQQSTKCLTCCYLPSTRKRRTDMTFIRYTVLGQTLFHSMGWERNPANFLNRNLEYETFGRIVFLMV